MTTTPTRTDTKVPDTPPRAGPLRLLARLARNTWRALTSMGTALVLLFLLALAAVPGALRSHTKISETLLVSPATRLLASEAKAM